ncbi:MAG: hypothetical protein J6U20_02935 [Fibrobacter sp.]|nr:hypothetical protein [Fibrobacter sp.]
MNQKPLEPKVRVDANTTDDQKFSYMLGVQFAGPSFENIAMRLGEYFDVDYLSQGVIDNAKALKDTSFKVQIPMDSMRIIDSYFAEVSAKRTDLARPDSATEMSFNGDYSKLRAYVDSVMKTLPIKRPAVVTYGEVKVNEKTTEMQKYSYVMGTQLHTMFHGVEKQFDQDFDGDFFLQGVRDACMNVLDTTHAVQMSSDSIKAVNDRYVVKVREHMQKRREEFMRQKAEAAAAARDSADAANDSAAKAAETKAPAEAAADKK